MCTLGLVLGVSERFPLIVAANRDEAHARPSTPPELWPERPPLVAGRDLRAGGSWLGVNAHGVVAGLTNLWTGAPPDPARRSRGAIVRELLACTSLDAARRYCAELRADDYNPFLAVCAQLGSGGFWVQAQDALEVHELAAGVHAFGNSAPALADAKPSAAARALRAALAASEDEAAALLAALRPVLAEHRGERGPRESVCVHTEVGYGTVSSSIYLLGERWHCFHAAGAPCEAPFADYSPLLEQLRSP